IAQLLEVDGTGDTVAGGVGDQRDAPVHQQESHGFTCVRQYLGFRKDLYGLTDQPPVGGDDPVEPRDSARRSVCALLPSARNKISSRSPSIAASAADNAARGRFIARSAAAC